MVRGRKKSRNAKKEKMLLLTERAITRARTPNPVWVILAVLCAP